MILIADGDILLFRSCAAVEREAVFGTTHVLYSEFEDARQVLEGMVKELEEQANAEEVVLSLSHKKNWRRNIFKEYKGNRKDTRKPLAYYALEEYAEQHFETLRFTGIEADDIMGIYADREDYAIWSLDKDLKQCPGHHLVDDEIVYITKEEGDRFHLYQALVGDVTDNYGGCPGIGDKMANEFLDAPFKFVQVERELKSGPRKGQTVLEWNKAPTDNLWEGVVSLYEKAGLTEADALVQARVARILRDGEYDFENERVKLWKP